MDGLVSPIKVAIRVDASNQMGSGHVMRCLTLAEELREYGAEITFICRLLPGNFIELINSRGFPVAVLAGHEPGSLGVGSGTPHASWLGVDWVVDAEETISVLNGSHWYCLLVDHYAIDALWESKVSTYVDRLVVIDDLADRMHACDLLLDQNLPVQGKDYRNLVPNSCQILSGPFFSLLKPEFFRRRLAMRNRGGEVKRVLIFMGGADPSNITGKVLNSLEALKESGLQMDVVITAGSAFYDELYSKCAALPNTTLHVQTSDMASLMEEADLMIGGGGATTWERCCLGLPSVVICLAENQKYIAEEIARRRAAIYFGDSESFDTQSLTFLLQRLIARPGLMRRLGKRAFDLVDGRGTKRVAACIIGKFRISIVSDKESWINDYLSEIVANWRSSGHQVNWVHDASELSPGDCVFFLSYSRIVNSQVLQLNVHNIVVHESDLPLGRGWSPLTWQILEGKNCIPVTLFEAEEDVDSGAIYDQQYIDFSGNELINELRKKQAMATVELCDRFIENYPTQIPSRRKQKGAATYYRRRNPKDSALDPYQSLAEQFNLLRVVDNQRYPAWFELAGSKYIMRIEKISSEGD